MPLWKNIITFNPKKLESETRYGRNVSQIVYSYREYSSCVEIFAPGFRWFQKNANTFWREILQVSFIVYTYIYIGLKQSNGSKNQRFTLPLTTQAEWINSDKGKELSVNYLKAPYCNFWGVKVPAENLQSVNIMRK